MRENHSGLLVASIMVLLISLLSPSHAFTLDLRCVQDNAANYNSKMKDAPFLLTSFLGSEKINLIVVRENGTLFRAGLDMVGGRIERVIEGRYEDPTILMNTSERAMNEVIASADKISTFRNFTDQGRIAFQADGWLAQAKLKVILANSSVLQFGYNLFFG